MKKWVIGLACVAMGVATAMWQDPAVWFNEINYDPAGTDDAGTEWLEVAGPAGVDLSSYVVVLYNGANGGSYGTTTLSGTIDDEGCGYGAVELTYGAANSLQNGAPDGMALASVSAGVTTLGIPLGIGVIVFTVIITGLYVRRANGEFDRMTRDILEDANP